MRPVVWLPVSVALGVVATARAQDGKVREIPVPPQETIPGAEPDPLADPVPGPVAPEAGAPDPGTPEPSAPPTDAGGRRDGSHRPRRDARQVAGEPPTALAGVWSIVQITQHGETEDYHLKMERAGRALDEACVVTATWFDFGPPGAGALPDRITITEVQRCEKGGLGSFASETSVTTPVTWSTGGGTTLTLPEVRAEQQLIRLRLASDSGRPPSNWVGPELRVERESSAYAVLAEYDPRKKGGDRPVALHLTAANGAVWHLERLQAFE